MIVKDMLNLANTRILREDGWSDKNIELFEKISKLKPKKSNFIYDYTFGEGYSMRYDPANMIYNPKKEKHIEIDKTYFTYEEILGFQLPNDFYSPDKFDINDDLCRLILLDDLKKLFGYLTCSGYAYDEESRKRYIEFQKNHDYKAISIKFIDNILNKFIEKSVDILMGTSTLIVNFIIYISIFTFLIIAKISLAKENTLISLLLYIMSLHLLLFFISIVIYRIGSGIKEKKLRVYLAKKIDTSDTYLKI